MFTGGYGILSHGHMVQTIAGKWLLGNSLPWHGDSGVGELGGLLVKPRHLQLRGFFAGGAGGYSGPFPGLTAGWGPWCPMCC